MEEETREMEHVEEEEGMDDAVVAMVEAAVAQERGKREEVERRLAALERGIPAERAERYVRLAGTYMEEGVAFGAAMDVALRDFPLSGHGGMPRVVARGRGGRVERGWKQMTLMERAKVFKEDPEKARSLAAAAGERMGD